MDRLIYESYDAVTTRGTEVLIDADTGLPLIVRTQDVRPIIESAKRIASNFDKYRARKQEFVHVARIDNNTFANLTRLGITRDERAFNGWLNTREGRAFRCDDGRKL
jgi:hypothetical protein